MWYRDEESCKIFFILLRGWHRFDDSDYYHGSDSYDDDYDDDDGDDNNDNIDDDHNDDDIFVY